MGSGDPASAPRRVAVLLPVRNGGAALGRALESLWEQTYRAFHVIAADDGSSDETPRVLEACARRWSAGSGPSLTWLRLEPGRGIAGALIAAAGQIREETFLARQDADDVSLPSRFARQMEFLETHPDIGVVATGIETVKGPEVTDGWRRYEAWLSACSTPEEIALNLWIESPLPHPTVMMRTESYRRAGGYREVSWPEDYDLWLRMRRAGIPMAKLPEILYQWHDLPARASRSLPAYSPERFLACRAHHLARYLRETDDLNGRPIVIWGAGRDGRRAARALAAEGVAIEAFLDIDPRKIGRRAYGRLIWDAGVWLAQAAGGNKPGRALVLAAVGTAGARALIRERLVARGFREGADFLCLA